MTCLAFENTAFFSNISIGAVVSTGWFSRMNIKGLHLAVLVIGKNLKFLYNQ